MTSRRSDAKRGRQESQHLEYFSGRGRLSLGDGEARKKKKAELFHRGRECGLSPGPGGKKGSSN